MEIRTSKRKYSEEFKIHAVTKIESGKLTSQKSIGIITFLDLQPFYNGSSVQCF
jgi:hypothetical protein